MSLKGRNQNTLTVHETMRDLFKSLGFQHKFDELEIRRIWFEIFSKAITERTEKIAFFDGILTVTISSAPLRHELTISSAQLIEKLHEKLGRPIIKELKIWS